jgi:2,3-bisphosphoglycerate-independent phosphoglycerate mutase
LVTLRYNREKTRAVMEDYSGGHISTAEAAILIKDIGERLGTSDIRFYPGVSYRHLMVWREGELRVECVPPHDIIGKDICDYLPAGCREDVLRKLMMDSVSILSSHSVNRERLAAGKRPANSIWFWGQGKKPRIPRFREKYNLDGALVSAVDLTKGLGVYAGFEILQVPGVTGYLDTNYAGKAEYSLRALENVDLVYVHVEAPDEAGHSGNYVDKVKAIEDFDALVVGTIMRGAQSFKEYRILLMPDHATPIEAKTHTDEPIPFVMYDSRSIRDNTGATFDESILTRKDIMVVEEGYRLMDHFIKGTF